MLRKADSQDWLTRDGSAVDGGTTLSALGLSLLPQPAVHVTAEPYLVPSDPVFGAQWHLINTGQTGGTAGADINVASVWDDYTGDGVLIGIIDDGVEHTHADLSANYDTSLDFDARDYDLDSAPGTSSDNHGTAVAGIAGASANNGTGVVGAAFDATITAFRMGYGSAGSLAQERLVLQQEADVLNNSWGYGGFFYDDFTTAAFAQQGASVQNAVETGRDGLGTVWVFAAGNSGDVGQDTNYHSYTSSRFTISVGAVDHDGNLASFSTPGAPNLVSTPGVNVTTTDRSAGAGYAPGDVTTISGTSFSSPLTSGVVALLLEANPDLGYRDVQEILAYSARLTGGSGGVGTQRRL